MTDQGDCESQRNHLAHSSVAIRLTHNTHILLNTFEWEHYSLLLFYSYFVFLIEALSYIMRLLEVLLFLRYCYHNKL